MAFPITITQTLSTFATPADVWRALEEVERWPQVIFSLAKATLEPKGALKPGSLIRTRAAPGNQAADRDYRVVTAEPPRCLVLAVEDADYRAVTRYQITPHGEDETDVTVTSTLDAVGPVQSVRFLLWRARIAPVLKANTRERTQALLNLAERIATGG